MQGRIKTESSDFRSERSSIQESPNKLLEQCRNIIVTQQQEQVRLKTDNTRKDEIIKHLLQEKNQNIAQIQSLKATNETNEQQIKTLRAAYEQEQGKVRELKRTIQSQEDRLKELSKKENDKRIERGRFQGETSRVVFGSVDMNSRKQIGKICNRNNRQDSPLRTAPSTPANIDTYFASKLNSPVDNYQRNITHSIQLPKAVKLFSILLEQNPEKGASKCHPTYSPNLTRSITKAEQLIYRIQQIADDSPDDMTSFDFHTS